ncbi:MAG TPA: hypothetical protein VE110_01600, partial [Gemmatimonadaceae bacterium]|nr:hypothetical protein [Gemmatimonadaceae bacterium]
VRLGALKPSPRKPEELVGTAEVLDAKGKPDQKIAAGFQLTGDVATLSFSTRLPPGMVQFDGWYEWYRILRTTENGFFGTWFTESGPTVPLEGYFCAMRAEQSSH